MSYHGYRGGLVYAGLVEQARELRRRQTPPEKILWHLLRNRQFLGLKFRRQHQIGTYIADFYCHEAKLVVELDGGIHEQPETKKKDGWRDDNLEALGFRVVRIANHVLLNDPAQALKKIENAAAPSSLPSEASLPSPSGRGAGGEGSGRLGVSPSGRGAGGEPSLPSPSGRGAGGEPSLPSPSGRGAGGEGSGRPPSGRGAGGEGSGRLGVFWHTQGSGKSVSMIFFSQKVLRKVPGDWTFVIVTDRRELDEQIYKNFASTGAITETEAQAESSRHLRQLLGENHRYVFTLIQKFRTERGEAHPVLSERDDVIVITDEAHRSQYDTLALNMRRALPNASFLAFTGTPLIIGEEKTREVFGDYVSIYDFRQSVEDGATVPLYYENRIPELQLTNENLNEDMERLLEEAELDEEQEKKLEREFAREYHLITRDDRVEAVAEDVVEHFTSRGFQGKAMVICIDKATAVLMHDKVRKHWDRKLETLRKQHRRAPQVDRPALEQRIREMAETDMAVVISQTQNEIHDLKEKGLDIRPHRKRMLNEDLETHFKDPEHPFRLVFVCAMWMTGFDVPSCSTLYLDKPMRNHTLMQTIARANRVYRDKVSGLIVDYVGVFRNLERALAIYGTGGTEGGERPVDDKAALVAALENAIDETSALCAKQGVDLQPIEDAGGFERIGLLDDAVDGLVASDEHKKRFLDQAANVYRLYKAVLPDPAAHDLQPSCVLIRVLAEKIRGLTPPADISNVMQQVEDLLDSSIAAEGYVIREPSGEYGTDHRIDLSGIDFEALKERFEQGRKHTEAERVKGLVARQLRKMVRLNRTRMDYLERFQRMIDEYNSGSVNVEEFFGRLMAFAKSLTQEEQRAVSEKLSEEELALFDLLTKPGMELTRKDRAQVKKTARELLATLKREKLVLDWRKRQQARASVRVTIETVLDQGLPRAYTPEVYQEKSDLVYQHVFDSYFGAGRSVYAVAA